MGKVSKMANIKTNAMRILEQMKIEYNGITYNSNDGKIDGVSVSEKIGKDPKFVYKTLVVQGHSNTIYVFLLPVKEELDLKKAAKAAGEKSVEMIHVKDLLKFTGYIRGGCSPIGMKKDYKTFIDISALEIDKIIVSGGKIGVQIEMETSKLIQVCHGEIVDLTIK
ncbi:Cys-tRNA(Pro)/Cys-tRNA(Cys) deacylase [Tissierella praeacuta DSM 18095]|uniref:Cys-tRNA(Pro)/Cys-tRNA(Cys) deacylase n=2 Tax=Tissierella praeacuta TaxID=43131 RepID=A0A1M4W1Y1_9FIRM|nr:Cys-tRNA(Pro)/Cys-tRNA(Cys) deacylase [Tissierella praeacuta]SHE75160.1 Cys-tRNA(Pro)/Cys-tRNA(Cys) deacylase [Tissierella praeacuta DSM 18095]SUP00199.1 Cys-tRNA(Pro)/Cys-tRNA(Cys) deacylase ybaK [Tissierella praeacuta]